MTNKSLKGTLFSDLLQKIESCKEDYAKAKGGSRTAGSRVRSQMLAVKKLSEAVYKEMNGVKRQDSK
jgi:hypothetical protein